MTKKITLTNSFHNTTAIVVPAADGTISRAVKLRADRELCGFADCQCAKSQLTPADSFEQRFVVVWKE